MAKKALIILVVFIITILAFNFYFQNWNKRNLQNKENLPQFNTVNEVRSESNMWGQPAKLMFPDINNPKYVSAKKANDFIKDNDEVYFFKSNNTFYIYPGSILSFHHIVNDTINGEPVAVTLCLLSDSAILYSRNIDGKAYSFGVLGPLYFGNLVIYDKETDSYFIQLTGEAFKGKLFSLTSSDTNLATSRRAVSLSNLVSSSTSTLLITSWCSLPLISCNWR